MAVVSTFDGIISRISNGYSWREPFYGEFQSARVNNLGATGAAVARFAWILPVPNPLPTGVTSFHLSKVAFYCSTVQGYIVGKTVLLGTLAASGSNPGTFTAGSTMPNVTELGATFQSAGGLWIEVTGALSGTLGTLSITFTDENGTSRTVTSTPTTGAVVGTGAFNYFISGATVTGQARAVTAMSWNGASPTGTVKVWGVIPLAWGRQTLAPGVTNNITHSFSNYPLGAGDTLAIIAPSNSAAATVGWLEFWGDS